MSKADQAAGIHHKVTPELAAVTLNPTPWLAPDHETSISPNRSRAPRTNQRALESEFAIGGPLRVEPQLKWYPGFLQPGSRQRLGAEGNDYCPRVAALEKVPVAAQLCHMLAAGQSTQVAQKDKKRRLARLPGLGQRGGPPIQRGKNDIRSGPADF